MLKMLLQIILFFAPCVFSCTLSKMYIDEEVRFMVYEKLAEVFEIKFDLLLEEASIYKPYIYCPAIHFKKDIKSLFIEEGFVFDTLRDLDKALNYLNYLEVEKFKIAKVSFEGLTKRNVRCD